MELDPGIHIAMHSVLSLKPGVTARYASMSQEQKNARNLRQREARKKKKGVGEFHICCSTYILPCNLHGSTFHQLVACINTPVYWVMSCPIIFTIL